MGKKGWTIISILLFAFVFISLAFILATQLMTPVAAASASFGL
jgi:hypothetical protein